MTVKPSELRRNLFALLDRCLETDEVISVRRRDGANRIAAEQRRLTVGELAERGGVLIDGETLDRFSPSQWSPDAFP